MSSIFFGASAVAPSAPSAMQVKKVMTPYCNSRYSGVDAKGEAEGNIDLRSAVQPDLSGKGDSVVRATW
jgi:hypothetical protein